MSDYAKFVQAVAGATRDVAMDGVLNENRVLHFQIGLLREELGTAIGVVGTRARK